MNDLQNVCAELAHTIAAWFAVVPRLCQSLSQLFTWNSFIFYTFILISAQMRLLPY